MIRKANAQDAPALGMLASMLWPHHSADEMTEEFKVLLKKADAACFLAYDKNQPVAFVQCQLRHDYVEGTENSPVGYLEGIYVMDAYRERGIARKLLTACEEWAKTMGCREFASDCELGNDESLRFHLRTGFEEANRIICFVKRI
jgi:aminoglycoside 6'-N-acetyltransferase I